MFLFSIPMLRERYCRLRFNILKQLHGIKQGTDEGVLHLSYSRSHFGSYTSFKGRVNYLVKMTKEISPKFRSKLVLLSIGPRFESELYGYRSLGFQWRHIHAIDTFSYSPKINIGNMHNLEYPKDFFDVIVCGWTIAYSAEPNSAFQEFQRVLKPGGKLILTWDLPENFVINDSTRLTLSRKTDIDDSSTILPEENILIKVSTYFSIQRIEIGKLTFNSDTPFAMLALVKI